MEPEYPHCLETGQLRKHIQSQVRPVHTTTQHCYKIRPITILPLAHVSEVALTVSYWDQNIVHFFHSPMRFSYFVKLILFNWIILVIIFLE